MFDYNKPAFKLRKKVPKSTPKMVARITRTTLKCDPPVLTIYDPEGNMIYHKYFQDISSLRTWVFEMTDRNILTQEFAMEILRLVE